MDRADDILAVIRQLHEAVLEPDGWERALQPVIAAMSADTAVLLGEDLRRGSAEFTIGYGMSSETAATFRPVYSTSRVIRSYRSALGADQALTASKIVPVDIFARSRFYNEIVRPVGVFHAALAISNYAPDRRATLAIGRTLGRDDYDDASMEILRLIVPHLSTALHARRALGAAKLLARDAAAVLDRLDIGVILADADARPEFVNRRAHAIAAKADGLSLSSRGIAAARPDQTRMLHRAINAAAAITADLTPSDTVDTLVSAATAAAAARLRLPRPSSKPPLVVVVTPLCGARRKDVWGPSSSVAILVSEPDSPPRIDLDALAETHGLAPREAQVAALLARGLDPKEIAAALGIGLGTAREHLKRALAKTDTHRQANLVRLVLSDFTLPVR